MMRKLFLMISFSLSLFIFSACSNEATNDNTGTQEDSELNGGGIEITMRLNDIHIRDSYIYVDEETETYYLTGTAQNLEASDKLGFVMYESKDLIRWSGPISLLTSDELDYEAQDFWAPEIHYYQGSYYLFGTFGPKNEYRRTQIWKAESIDGPYSYHGQATPEGMYALDATPFEEDGVYWSVYCSEWIDPNNNWDGQMRAVQLKDDFSGIKMETDFLLFNGSDNPNKITTTPGPSGGHVTDGPYFHRNELGELFMVWSTFTTIRGINKYSLTYAISDNGKLDGNWIQAEEPLYDANGGHGMIFETFEGELKISFHTPNTAPYEKTVIYTLDDSKAGELRLK
jgi:arabinan endo-1,5-alpha-L-arabinosidase